MTNLAKAALTAPEAVYPTRRPEREIITERQDPVFYGNMKNGALSEEQAMSYERNGFLAIESFFSADEVKDILGEVDKMRDSSADINSNYIIREPQSQEIRSFFYVHQYNKALRGLYADKRILGIVEQILGSRVYIHQSRVNLKPGFNGKEFYWHSDFETWHAEDGMPRMRALSCSISLTENYEFNGPLMVVPGSHKQFIGCVGETPDDNYKKSLRKQEYGVPSHEALTDMVERNGIVSIKGKPGSVVFFDCNIMHGSNSNITPYPRTNLFTVYNSVENTLQEPFAAEKPRPEFIAARKDFSAL